MVLPVALFRRVRSWAGVNLQTFRVFIAPNRPYRRIHLTLPFLITLGTIPYLATPWLIKFFFDRALAQHSSRNLVIAVALLLLVSAFTFVVPLIDMTVFGVLGLRAVRRLRLGAYSALLRRSSWQMRRYSLGDLCTRIVNDTSLASSFGGQKLIFPMVAILQLIIAVPTALLLSWQLMLCEVPLLAARFLVDRIFQRRAAMMNNIMFPAECAIQSAIIETVNAHALPSSGRSYRHTLRRFSKLIEREATLAAMNIAAAQVQDQTTKLISTAESLSMWIVGGVLYLRGILTLGDFLAFQAVVPLLGANFQKLADPIIALRSQRPMADRLTELLELPAPPCSVEPVDVRQNCGAGSGSKGGQSGWVSLCQFTHSIDLRRVTFGYMPGRRVINGLSQTIAAGDLVRIAGCNGCGKSTLINLILGAGAPHDGEITIDGVNVLRLSRRSINSLFAVAPQDPGLIGESVHFNLALGGDPRGARLQHVAAELGLDHMIAGLPNGYQTLVGENGGALSGGQRQLIALVRALAAPTPILVLDEPTSHLDEQTKGRLEQLILRQHRGGRTVILVSHDPDFCAAARSIQLDSRPLLTDAAKSGDASSNMVMCLS